MIFSRVLFKLRFQCIKEVFLPNTHALENLSLCKKFRTVTNQLKKVKALKASAERSRHQGTAQTCVSLAVVYMEPAIPPCGRETLKVESDEDNEEEEEKGGPETRVQEMTISGQLESVRMDVLDAASVPAASNTKISFRQKRREKWKLKKKQLRSPDVSNDLMSELPFALTSPTTWKELGFSNSESTETKRKRKRGDKVDSEEGAEGKKKKRESQRPNYFLSIPITNSQISSTVNEVQENILQQEPRLAKAMIPVPTLHITLLVTHLADQEQVDLAAAVLAQAEPSVAEILGGRDLVLPFSGIKNFRKEVVFVGLAEGPHRPTLDYLAELLKRRFEERGLLQGDSRDFEPHLTIMKLSRASKLRSQGIKRVDPSLYTDYTSRFFGNLTAERVDLCSMLKKKQKDGYYHTETSLHLGGRRRSEPDEAELLRVSKRLVEDAVNRALQQYKQETLQNGGGPNANATKPPGSSEDTSEKTDTTGNSTDNRK